MTLREFGVSEYADGPVHIVLGSAEPRPLAAQERVQSDTGTVANPKRAAYEKLFRGKAPSFDAFRTAGLVSE